MESSPAPKGPSEKESDKEYEDPYTAVDAENKYILALQIGLIILVSGAGSIGSGAMLNTVQQWEAFIVIKDLYLLMPVVQGLKSNVDTCLAARLATQINLGNFNERSQIISQTVCNMALVQVQAIVGSVVISVYCCTLGAVVNRRWSVKHLLLLATCATLTTCISCFVLDLILIGIIIATYRLHINPDNIICPIASAAGDLVTMVLFSHLVNVTFFLHHTAWWIFILIMCVFVVMILPVAVVLCLRSAETKKVLYTGWFAVIVALVFSSFSSLVMDLVIEHYEGYTLFQPVLNGTTANLISILLTRLSTMLFRTSAIGTLHPKVKLWVPPHKVWFYGTPQAKCVRLLIGIGIPGQLIFVFLADYAYTHCVTIHAVFIMTYVFVSIVCMFIMLYVAHLMTLIMYKWKINPDNAAIPYVNAISDFTGSSILAANFAFLLAINQEYLHNRFGRRS